MQYTLYENTGQGILTDRTPIMGDVADTFTVSFILPKNDATYIALFKGQGGEYRKSIKDGQAEIPHKLLWNEQFVALFVMELIEEKVTRTYKCEPLKVTSLFKLRQNQWEISGGLSDKSCMERLGEIEKALDCVISKLHAVEEQCADAMNKQDEMFKQSKALVDKAIYILTEKSASIDSLAENFNSRFDEVLAQNKILSENYNKAIETINGMNERLVALEGNYDPTIIK